MKKYWAANALLGFTLLFSFQNCQKRPYQDAISDSLARNISQHDIMDNRIVLSQENIDQVQFYFEEKKQTTNQDSNYTLLINKVYEINLQSGEITISDNTDDENSLKYCLTDDLKNELENVLKSSSICKSTGQVIGKVCAQVLAKPYAAIITRAVRYELGYATDSCGSNKIDLCDDQDSLLKGIAAAIKHNLESLVCR